jgi:cytochrome P450
MGEATATPVRLTGTTALRWAWQFARDPLMTTRHSFEAFGPFVILAEALPFTVPFIKTDRVILLGAPLVWAAGAAFHRELLSDTATWRGVSLLPGGPRNSAARRISLGLSRITGDRHEHYRNLLLPSLSKASVTALTEKLARLAEAEVMSWSTGETIDLWVHVSRLMRRFAIELLFGGPSEEAYLIADLVSRLMERKWARSAFAFPINLPITSYGSNRA